MISASNGNEPIVTILITAKANIDLQDQTYQSEKFALLSFMSLGMTAIMFASKNGHEDVVAALIAGGANQNLQNK